jgi:DNA-binding XRE family transcriptional regulator
LPEKRITQHQESLYMSKRQQGKSQETAAACAAISEQSGRRIEKGERPYRFQKNAIGVPVKIL